jgi:hypothetical protein
MRIERRIALSGSRLLQQTRDPAVAKSAATPEPKQRSRGINQLAAAICDERRSLGWSTALLSGYLNCGAVLRLLQTYTERCSVDNVSF